MKPSASMLVSSSWSVPHYKGVCVYERIERYPLCIERPIEVIQERVDRDSQQDRDTRDWSRACISYWCFSRSIYSGNRR